MEMKFSLEGTSLQMRRRGERGNFRQKLSRKRKWDLAI